MVLRSNVSLTALPVEETENKLQEESIMDALNVDEDYKHERVGVSGLLDLIHVIVFFFMFLCLV